MGVYWNSNNQVLQCLLLWKFVFIVHIICNFPVSLMARNCGLIIISGAFFFLLLLLNIIRHQHKLVIWWDKCNDIFFINFRQFNTLMKLNVSYRDFMFCFYLLVLLMLRILVCALVFQFLAICLLIPFTFLFIVVFVLILFQ